MKSCLILLALISASKYNFAMVFDFNILTLGIEQVMPWNAKFVEMEVESVKMLMIMVYQWNVHQKLKPVGMDMEVSFVWIVPYKLIPNQLILLKVILMNPQNIKKWQ